MNDKKKFDAVKMMRALREEVGKELDGKSYEEQRRYIDERVQLRRSKKGETKSGRKAV